MTSADLYNLLNILIPTFTLVNFLLLLILIYINRGVLRRFFPRVNRKTLLALLLIFLLALSIRILLSPKSYVMFTDEALYVQAGKDMLLTGSQGNYAKYIGWPFILTGIFGTAGLSNQIAIFADIFLGSLAAVLIFLLAQSIFNDARLSLLASLIYSFSVSSIFWSGTAETISSSVFFILISIILCFAYYKKGGTNLFFLALASVSLAALFRAENYVLFPLFIIGFLLFQSKKTKWAKLIVPVLIILLLALPHLVRLTLWIVPVNWMESDTAGQRTGENWSLSNLINNTREHGLGVLLKNKPFFILPLALLGIFLMLRKHRPEAIFFLAWFLLFYLAYYSSWPTNMESWLDTKIYYPLNPIVSIFSSLSLVWVIDLICRSHKSRRLSNLTWLIVIIIIFVGFSLELEHVPLPADVFRLATKVPDLVKNDIPPGCLVVAARPELLEINTGFETIPASRLIEEPDYRTFIISNHSCVLFYSGISCYLNKSQDEVAWCRYFRSNFSMVLFKEYSLGNTTFGLYWLKNHTFPADNQTGGQR